MAELVKEYYSGQGMVYAAPYVGGVVQTEKMRWIGNVPALELSFETDTEEHKESHSGTRQKDLVLRKELSAAFSLTMDSTAASMSRAKTYSAISFSSSGRGARLCRGAWGAGAAARRGASSGSSGWRSMAVAAPWR